MDRVVPAEWSPHLAMWLGFPSHADLWLENLEPARAEVEALARALAGPGGERVRLMAYGDQAVADAKRRFADDPRIEIVPGRFGDIWFRDTGPIFVRDGGETRAVGFTVNGWGGKYELPHDEEVADQIAVATPVSLERFDVVLEGGALEHDGAGTVITTRQCVLNPNRNRNWTETQAEDVLGRALGMKKTIWLDDGLANDHTDGHVDNLARFLRTGVVACPEAFGDDDPNAEIYDLAADVLARSADAEDRPLEVVRIPSPGRMQHEDGEIVPASHMNFLVANRAVIAPLYENADAGEAALRVLRAQFPDRAVIGLSSSAILTGGGSFHCISQQEPA
ncbi:MAG TPA: agmatine deiminase family protein [Caulobacteraceae bacterium]|jgi:agmatine deiminase|nr:agmatine deiminase family protein [Caulobacteraceae bacterium]